MVNIISYFLKRKVNKKLIKFNRLSKTEQKLYKIYNKTTIKIHSKCPDSEFYFLKGKICFEYNISDNIVYYDFNQLGINISEYKYLIKYTKDVFGAKLSPLGEIHTVSLLKFMEWWKLLKLNNIKFKNK